jgi:hypothetical protein
LKDLSFTAARFSIEEVRTALRKQAGRQAVRRRRRRRNTRGASNNMLRILGKKARRVFREEFIGIREHWKAWSLPGGGREDARSFLWSSTRHAHSSGLYVHHTIGGVGRDSAAVTIGLLHALERFQPGVGYFRPIDQTTIGGHRSKLMKQVFKLRDDLQSMQAMTQEHAYELVTHDRIDDLLEEILKGETD